MSVYAFKSFEYPTSSSGGAFPAIARALYEEVGDEFIVFGAAFNDDFSVKHFGKKYRDGILCFQESKYVRSDISEPLEQIQELIRQKIPVLFVGTPCQVAAINSIIKKSGCDSDSLLTIDLICHGTPKSELWRGYVKLIEQKYGKIKRVCFRNNFTRKKGRTFVELEDGRIIYDPDEMKAWMRLFSTCVSLYKGCFNCNFRNKDLNRPADITIGDFWGVQELIPEFKGIKDVSLVIPHTDKGQRAFDHMVSKFLNESILIKECNDERWRVFNPHLFEQTPIPLNYDEFWNNYERYSIEEFYKKYSKASLKYKIKRGLSDMFEKMGLKYKLKYVIKHFKR